MNRAQRRAKGKRGPASPALKTHRPAPRWEDDEVPETDPIERDPLQDRVDSLSRLRQIEQAQKDRAAAEAKLVRVVRSAHELGASWADIGTALGISRQAARQRFAQPEPTGGADD